VLVNVALVDAVFREVPKASLDAEPAVCFVLDEGLRLIYCNPAWDRFAGQNDAPPQVYAEKALGTPVLESTSGELFGYYQSLYRSAFADRKPRDHDFHCSSGVVERLMRMHVYGLRNAPALLVSCSVRVERPHTVPSSQADEAAYRDRNGLIVMCGNCRRTRRADLDIETWEWVSEHVAHQPRMVSHSVCGLCLEYYYPVTAQS